MSCGRCHGTIFPWQRKSRDGESHDGCEISFKRGYEQAYEYCQRENKLAGLPPTTVLFSARFSRVNRPRKEENKNG